MSRLSTALVSLIPCLAGLGLAAVCVLSILNYGEASPQGLKILGGAGALLGLMAAVTPVMAFLTTPAGAASSRKKASKKSDEDKGADAGDGDEGDQAESKVAVTDDNLEVFDDPSEGDVDSPEDGDEFSEVEDEGESRKKR